MGLFGKSSQEKAAEENIKLNNKFTKDTYKFNKKETKRQNRFNKETYEITKENEKTFREFGDAERSQEYQDLLKIRGFEYQQQVRQFNESERIYGMQRNFNAQAESNARAAEARRFNEITTGMSFEQQDMLVKMMQEEGAIQARGQSGNSAQKNLGSVLAGYGRNQAIMAESLLSAKADSRGNYRQIAQDRYGADLNAESRRMLTPMRAPDPTAPLALPQAVIQKPYRLRTAPAAPQQKIGSSSPSFGQILGTGLGIASTIATGGFSAPITGAILGGLGTAASQF